MNTVLRLSGSGVVIDGVGFDIHTMLYAAGATVLGVQLVLFSLVTRTIGGFIDVRSRGAKES